MNILDRIDPRTHAVVGTMTLDVIGAFTIVTTEQTDILDGIETSWASQRGWLRVRATTSIDSPRSRICFPLHQIAHAIEMRLRPRHSGIVVPSNLGPLVISHDSAGRNFVLDPTSMRWSRIYVVERHCSAHQGAILHTDSQRFLIQSPFSEALHAFLLRHQQRLRA